MHPSVHCSTIYNIIRVRTWTQPKDERIKDKDVMCVCVCVCVCVFIMEYYSAIKRNGFESVLVS